MNAVTFTFGNDDNKIEIRDREKKGNSTVLLPSDYVVIDIETTGFSPVYDKIIELSALKVRNNTVTDEFTTLVNPGCKIDGFISELTGITNEMLKKAPKIKEALPKFIDFLGTDHLVGHNVNFDINFIYDNSLEVLKKPLENDFTDTMRVSKRILKELPHHRLGDISEYYKVNYEGAHRALVDCRITKECFDKLKEDVIKEFENVENFEKSIKKSSYGKSINIKEIIAQKDSFDESHPLFDKYCVFTGTLEKMVRKDAMQIVVDFGGKIEKNVTKNTNYLILGNNDYCSTIKDGKSTKQKKAEELKLQGSEIEIIPEDVFYELIADK